MFVGGLLQLACDRVEMTGEVDDALAVGPFKVARARVRGNNSLEH